MNYFDLLLYGFFYQHYECFSFFSNAIMSSSRLYRIGWRLCIILVLYFRQCVFND